VSTAATYGALAALSWATAGLLPLRALSAAPLAAQHGQHSGCWTGALAGLGALQDVHIDLPMLLPGEVRARMLCWGGVCYTAARYRRMHCSAPRWG
jgi:hypothetical protein